MKNFYFLLIVILTTTLTQAQTDKQTPTPSLWSPINGSSSQRAFLYDFSMDTMTYADLSNPVSINNGEIWDDPFYSVPVPFPFYFMGEKIDFLNFGDLGGILFGYSNSMDSEIAAVFAPLDTDLIDRGSGGGVSLSPLSYQVIGTPGDQILIIEWKNAGSYDEMKNLGTLNMYISFQVWLHESDNRIIFHYGPSMIDMPLNFYYLGPGAVIGLAALDLETFDGMDYHLLQGPANNPILTAEAFPITGTPSPDTRYIFSPDLSSISANSSPYDVKVFPNPVVNMLYITCEVPVLEATLFSINGVPLRMIPEHDLNGAIDLRDLASGCYLLQLITLQGVHTTPILKSN